MFTASTRTSPQDVFLCFPPKQGFACGGCYCSSCCSLAQKISVSFCRCSSKFHWSSALRPSTRPRPPTTTTARGSTSLPSPKKWPARRSRHDATPNRPPLTGNGLSTTSSGRWHHQSLTHLPLVHRARFRIGRCCSGPQIAIYILGVLRSGRNEDSAVFHSITMPGPDHRNACVPPTRDQDRERCRRPWGAAHSSGRRHTAAPPLVSRPCMSMSFCTTFCPSEDGVLFYSQIFLTFFTPPTLQVF